MTNILHVSSSSNLKSSVSRQVGAQTLEALKAAHPDATIVTRDVVKETIPHLTPEVIDVFYEAGAPALSFADKLTNEVLAADVLLIEAPMYNFSIPSSLKAWIDHIARAGMTFKYGPNGPEGLATGKKAILVLSRAGVYSEGAMKMMEHQETYLRTVLGFIGITDVEVVDLSGMAYGPEKKQEALDNATQKIATLAKAA